MWGKDVIGKLLGRSIGALEDLADLRDALMRIENVDNPIP